MTRYLPAVNFEGGVVETPMEEWKPEEIAAHLDYYRALRKELVGSGEVVQSEVLAGPGLAKIVTSDGVTAPLGTDGPFQEFKEWLRSSTWSRRNVRSRSPRRSRLCVRVAGADDRQPGRHTQPGRRSCQGPRPVRGLGPARRGRRTSDGSVPPGRGPCAPLGDGGRHEGRPVHYRAAAKRTTSLPEQRYLATQAARLKITSDQG